MFVSNGKGTEIGSSMFPAFGKYYMEELNDTYSKDLDKAKELLKEAGLENGFTFTIKVPSNYTQHVETAQVIEQQLKALIEYSQRKKCVINFQSLSFKR